MDNNPLLEAVKQLPGTPGVYQFFNADQKLIYVGKAKNILKRVTSYFSKSTTLNKKTRKLVSEISKIEFVVSNTEFDALLLENNLIKENQPKYNILLKDDKTFPYLCILKERFPRIIYTRKYEPDQGEYFGPYTSVVAMKNVLGLIRKLYCIRTCNYNLSEANIESGKFKVCLEYHLGNCKGPCENLQREEDYLQDIAQARSILKGQLSIVTDHLINQMKNAAEQLEFERAHILKDKLETLERFQSKSIVVNRSITNIDVVTLSSLKNYAYVNYFQIKEGAINNSKTIEIKKRLEEPDDEIILFALQELRTQSKSESETVLSNIDFHAAGGPFEVIVPKIGDKKKLVSLSFRNALELRKQRETMREGKKDANLEVLQILQKDLGLPNLPKVIECFDNSNIMGTNPVASMVRFTMGRPDKKNYRHYNIKTVEGPNDFASMKEVVFRRYKKLIIDAAPLPDLILIDGGKGQLSSACEALQELSIYGQVPIAGIAKKLEEIYLPEDPYPVLINKKSVGLRLLQYIRDEAHRFAITFHRQKRSKSSLVSEMEELEGIGSKTVDQLLKKFKSVKKIKEASLEELSAIIGNHKATIIKALK